MTDYNPCQGCEFYNKPYWSVMNPCDNCPKQATSEYITTTTTNIHTADIAIPKFGINCVICGELAAEVDAFHAHETKVCDKCKAAIMVMRNKMSLE